eukprot:236389_1
MYKNNPIISCIVAKVTDGDTVRVQHKPWWLLFPKNEGKLIDRTVSVRLYGIAAPETGQPWGEEATRFVKRCLTPERQVQVKLLAIDRYGHAVGTILHRKRYASFWKLEDRSKELLKKGLAILFTGKSISYDGHRLEMERLEEDARKLKRGVWMNGGLDETPSQYRMRKRRRHTATCQLSR